MTIPVQSPDRTDPTEIPFRSRRMWWLLGGGLFCLAVIGRMCLPMHASDSMRFYEGIVWGILQQKNWGKQALVGVLEYGPLPALGLLLLTPFSVITGLKAATLFLAISQISVFGMLIRLFRLLTGRLFPALLLAWSAMWLIGLGLGSRASLLYLLQMDPFWINLIPLIAGIFYAMRWEQSESLRDLSLFSICCGLLVFCGIAGWLAAAALLSVVTVVWRDKIYRSRATTMLVIMPFGYALFLFFLFNLLVMENPFFGVGRFSGYLVDWKNGLRLFRSWKMFAIVPALVAGISALLWRHAPLMSKLIFGLALSSLPIFLMRRCGMGFIGGEYLFGGFFGVLLILPFFRCWKGEPKVSVLLHLVFAAMLASGVLVMRRRAGAGEEFMTDHAPSRAELIEYVDQHWEDSRILVFGARASVMYGCTESSQKKDQERFIGRLDLDVNMLRKQIEEEQFHLLVPPDNGRYYPRRHHFFCTLHGSGQPGWLFLEKTWGTGVSGWQLWRCIRKREIKLQ